MNNIVIIGYRGSGKTKVSQVLAKKLNKKLISIDNAIGKKVGDINVYVEKNGWKSFREIEHKVLEELHETNAIIDCGGGIVEDEENIVLLKRLGNVIFLELSEKSIIKRLNESYARPKLTNNDVEQEVKEMLKKRTPLYKKAADIIINRDNKGIKKTVDEIIEKINATKVCISIVETTLSEVKQAVQKAEQQADMLELRLDFIKDIKREDIPLILTNIKEKPVIVTCRRKQDHGYFEGAEEERISLFVESINQNVDYIDVEYDLGREIIKKIQQKIKNSKDNAKTKIIISYHNFDHTPELNKLQKIYDEIKTLKPNMIKIVTKARSINDNFIIFNLLKEKNDLVAFCMELEGQISRILAPKFRSRLTYAALEEEKHASRGQITIDGLEKVYHIKNINKETKVFGIIGSQAEHSKSKYIHNPSFKAKNINAVFIPFRVQETELHDFIKNIREQDNFNFQGVSVTQPHKISIMKYLDTIDETAQIIGAVNTLVNEDGLLVGYNTDYVGAMQALKEATDLENKRILVVGAGGATRAVVYGLTKEQCEITIINRTDETAKQLAHEFNVNVQPIVKLREALEEADVIINTTSVGMKPQETECIIPSAMIPKRKIIMDIIYSPLKTRLLEMAEKNNCKTIKGDRMLLFQGIKQFQLWTKQDPDSTIMEQELHKYLK